MAIDSNSPMNGSAHGHWMAACTLLSPTCRGRHGEDAAGDVWRLGHQTKILAVILTPPRRPRRGRLSRLRWPSGSEAELSHHRVGRALARRPGAADRTPQGFVGCFAGKENAVAHRLGKC